MSFVLFACLLVTAEGRSIDAAVIAPRELMPALKPLIEQRGRRSSAGHHERRQRGIDSRHNSNWL
jgi:hypothetical protein